MITGNTEPQLEVRVQAAADVHGKRITAVATLEKKETK
jgi:hypothetical protein